MQLVSLTSTTWSGQNPSFLPHPHTAAGLAAELAHGAGGAVRGQLAVFIGGPGAVQVAVRKVLHLEDLPQRDIGDIHAEAAHAAIFV